MRLVVSVHKSDLLMITACDEHGHGKGFLQVELTKTIFSGGRSGEISFFPILN